MILSRSFRIKVCAIWLLFVWFWRNPFHQWGTAGEAIAERYCNNIIVQEGKITIEALDILDEKIKSAASNARRPALLRIIVLPVLVLSTMGLVVHVDVQGAQFDLTSKFRELLLLLAVTLSVYLSFTGFISSALYKCLKLGVRRANLPKSTAYKYMNQTDLFLELVFSKEDTISLSYALNVLALLLFYLAHLVIFLFLDFAAYFYVALDIRAHPSFGGLSTAIANYTFFAASTVFLFTVVFSVGRFRYKRAIYSSKQKNSARYLKLFLMTSLRRRIVSGQI